MVTPGTLTDSELLSDKSEAILLSLHTAGRQRCGLAWMAVTQGRIHLAECSHDELGAWISRIAPSELIYSAGVTERFEQSLFALRHGGSIACPLSPRPDWQFDGGLGERKLLELLGAASLKAWEAEDLPLAHGASAALLSYAEHTQGRSLSHIHALQVQRDDELIALPLATRRNLELVKTLRGEDSPTLFSAGHLHDGHGQPPAQGLAAGAAPRPHAGHGAAGGHAGAAGRQRRRHGRAPGSSCASSSRA